MTFLNSVYIACIIPSVRNSSMVSKPTSTIMMNGKFVFGHQSFHASDCSSAVLAEELFQQHTLHCLSWFLNRSNREFVSLGITPFGMNFLSKGGLMTYQIGYMKMPRGEEVRQKILQSHLAYLNQEETPAKLEQRHNLEGLIAEFLSLVPHNQKFSCPEVEGALHNSIQENPNFSAYKGAAAFQALEKYATNLLSHPWRKEYKIVKLYSGYFKHTIERQLLNSESIFILLGYEQHDPDLLFLDGPVDPDHVTRVALDCLIAYVECQIMIQICEKITNYKCTWKEIHQVREDYVCRIDEAVRILQQLKRAAQEEEETSAEKDQIKESPEEYPVSTNNVLRNTPRTGVLVDLSNTWPNSARSENIPPSPPSQFDSTPYTTKQSNIRTAVSHSRSPSWSEGVSSQLDRQQQTRRRVARPEGIDDMWTDPAASNWSNHQRHGDISADGVEDSWELYMSTPRPSFQDSYNSYVDFDRNGYRMNYGQLPHVKNVYNSPYVTNFNPHFHPHNYPFMPHPDIFMNTTRQCRCHMCCEQPAMFPHRDTLGALDGRDRYSGIERSEVPPYVTRAFHQLSIDGYSQLPKPWHTSDGMQKPEVHKTIETVANDNNLVSPTTSNRRNHQTTKRASFYDNIGQEPELLSADVPSKREENINSYSQAKVTSLKNGLEKTVNLKSSANKVASTVELSHNSEVPNSCTSKSNFPRRDSDLPKWSCSFCTYFNSPDKKICEICGRSRFMGAESMPLVSGGRECPQCTLVNEKDAKDCTACGTSLKDSPTYI